MSATTTERFSAQGVWMILAGMAAGGLTAWFLRLVAWEDQSAAVIASSAALLPPAIANAAFQRRRRRAIAHGALGIAEVQRPPLLVVALAAGALLLAVNAISFVVGFVVGIGLGDGIEDEAQTTLAVNTAILLVGYPIMLLVAGAIGARAAHYLPRFAYAHLLTAVLLFSALQFAVDSILQITIESLLSAVVFAALGYAAVVIGAAIARRRHARFIAGRLLRRLVPEDLPAVIAHLHGTIAAGSAARAVRNPAWAQRPAPASADRAMRQPAASAWPAQPPQPFPGGGPGFAQPGFAQPGFVQPGHRGAGPPVPGHQNGGRPDGGRPIAAPPGFATSPAGPPNGIRPSTGIPNAWAPSAIPPNAAIPRAGFPNGVQPGMGSPNAGPSSRAVPPSPSRDPRARPDGGAPAGRA